MRKQRIMETEEDGGEEEARSEIEKEGTTTGRYTQYDVERRENRRRGANR